MITHKFETDSLKRTEALNRETDNSQVQDWFLSHIEGFIKKNWVIKGTQLLIRPMLNVYLTKCFFFICFILHFIFLKLKNSFWFSSYSVVIVN